MCNRIEKKNFIIKICCWVRVGVTAMCGLLKKKKQPYGNILPLLIAYTVTIISGTQVICF